MRANTRATSSAARPVTDKASTGQATTTIAAEPAVVGPWGMQGAGKPHEIEGWADATSVAPGTDVRLYVNTTAAGYDVYAYRMGFYGPGNVARLVWKLLHQAGAQQPKPTLEHRTNMVSASGWTPSVTVSTKGWAPGTYLFRLDASSGGQRYIPLTVRAPSAAGAVVLVNAVTTWQAYNDWGGYSLYKGPAGDFVHRARAVSFDRPYAGNGDGDFIGDELPLVVWAERMGLKLQYLTDVDLDAHPEWLAGAKAIISLGHDEYWSLTMRQAVQEARDRGVNLAFLGANAIFRHIRLISSPIGNDRVEINYKRANEDPMRAVDKTDVTSDWRDPPNPRPESVLTGVFYECNPVHTDMIVADPDAWMFAGTGVQKGDKLEGLVGPEYDRVDLSAPTPRPIQVIGHTPVKCHGHKSYSDAAYYTVPSGAGVFASGTSVWIGSLGHCMLQECGGTPRIVATTTTNLLAAFAKGPAGLEHPAIDNLRAVGITGSTTSSTSGRHGATTSTTLVRIGGPTRF